MANWILKWDEILSGIITGPLVILKLTDILKFTKFTFNFSIKNKKEEGKKPFFNRNNVISVEKGAVMRIILDVSACTNEKATLIYIKRWCIRQYKVISRKMPLSILFKVTLKAFSLSLSHFLSISIYISISQRISESSLDCGVKSITVLMRWHRAYIIFLWISISADTSHRRGSLRTRCKWLGT